MKSGQNAPGVSAGNLSPKYSVNGHKRTPGSNEQSGIHKYSINGHKRTPVAQTGNMENTNI